MANTGISNAELLKYALENGMIDMNTIQMQIEMNERKRYLEMHESKIWQGKDGYYYTYVHYNSANKNRKLLKKSSYVALEDAVVNHYKETSYDPLITDVFYEWINSKLKYGEIQKQTYERYEVDFKRFFEDSEFSKIKFRHITELQLEEFIRSSIHEKNLSAKSWANLRLLINGIFKFAKKRNYTNISITSFMGDLDISAKAFNKNKKRDFECVFSEKEMQLLIDYLWKRPTIGNLSVLFAAYTGMRVGEVVGLKWEDIKENHIHVNRTQIRYHDENGKDVHEVRDMPKTEAGIRDIIIVDGLRPVIRKLRTMNPFTEYVFMKNGEVITKHVSDSSIYYACEKVGIPKRGMHVLRKTYGTRLINAHIDEAIITSQIGHTDIKTTKKYYYYNDKSVDDMIEIIGKAINY